MKEIFDWLFACQRLRLPSELAGWARGTGLPPVTASLLTGQLLEL